MSPAKFLNGENNSNNPNGKKNSQQGKRSCVFTKTYIFNVANFVVVYDRLDWQRWIKSTSAGSGQQQNNLNLSPVVSV